MGFMDSLSISGSGMTAERLRMDVIADNLANVNTTRTPNGSPYRRQQVLFSSGTNSFQDTLAGFSGGGDGTPATTKGVQVQAIIPDQSPFKRVYQPGHPDADAQGYVNMPNVDTVTEMVDMMSASRAYEANVTAVQSIKGMAEKAIDIGRA
ncbi:flagellar basal-body rod protein FlgC [Capsulimonas corticalis]|uniref:Flagellar basal-body rod protein FlgC n=1 Tax=Capsulimonas corticalis TaxID=2219043 RepID=A0A402CT03_9BACT|nr:flagellar basal body rod protein FlgC [Capsulimonas corticalis]BDI30919.1 flagellar basal-body rod protein FlgC [Capsulimonas corticalis]